MKKVRQSTLGYFKIYLYRVKDNIKPGVVFDIDAVFLYNLFVYQKELCFFTGQQMTTSGVKDCVTDAVIDLIELEKGYIKGNVRLVARRIKYMKGPGLRPGMSGDEFVALCKEVAGFSELVKDVVTTSNDEQKSCV